MKYVVTSSSKRNPKTRWRWVESAKAAELYFWANVPEDFEKTRQGNEPERSYAWLTIASLGDWARAGLYIGPVASVNDVRSLSFDREHYAKGDYYARENQIFSWANEQVESPLHVLTELL